MERSRVFTDKCHEEKLLDGANESDNDSDGDSTIFEAKRNIETGSLSQCLAKKLKYPV